MIVNTTRMEVTNRQQKIFKRLFTDFIKEYTLVTNIKLKTILSVSKANIITFFEQVQENFDDFSKCSNTVLSKIDMLKEIDPAKVKIGWKTLHTLFIICIGSDMKVNGKNKDDVIKLFEDNRNAPPVTKTVTPFGMDPNMIMQMMPMVTGMLNQNGSPHVGGGEGQMGDLIKQTSDELMKSLEGKEEQLKNINPMELFSSLMAGNRNVGGVDLTDVINNLQVSISTKIENKELDPELLRNGTQKLLQSLPAEMKQSLDKLA